MNDVNINYMVGKVANDFASSVQKIWDSSSSVTGCNVAGFRIGAGFFFMSARTLYHWVGISFSSR